MKFSDMSINNTKNFIESNETKNNFRLNNKFFTRNRKIDFKNLVYYNLNKK